MYPEQETGSSGYIPLKIYILVFSIIASNCGLSAAQHMAQTSLRSSLLPSEVVEGRPTPSDISTTAITPDTSMTDKRLKKII